MSRNRPTAPSPQTFLARGLEGRIVEALRDTPVVCLLGPRQSGKSTLVSRIAPTRQLVSLDDAAYLKLAREDAQGFLAGLADDEGHLLIALSHTNSPQFRELASLFVLLRNISSFALKWFGRARSVSELR
jgi:hypothetical protein